MRPFLLVAAMVVALAGCAKGAHVGAGSPAYSGVGYVRVDDAIRRHPLYPQLVQYNEEIAVLQGAGAPAPPVNPAEMQREEAELQKRLAAAAADAKVQLAQLRAHYEEQERKAIQAALASAGVAPAGDAGAGVVAGVANDFQAQAKAVNEHAQQAFDAYRTQVVSQDRAQMNAEAKRLSDEANRKYRAKVRDLETAEAQFAQQLAQQSAPQRLELRTKLQNLALDDASRKQLEQQLEALDKADADQVAQMRNRDQAALKTYRDGLRTQMRSQMQAYAERVHRSTDVKLEQRAGVEREAVQKQVRALAPQVGAQLGGFDVSKLPANLRARVESIHRDFAKRYQADAQAALDRFNKMRAAIAARYAQLQSAGSAADAANAKQIAELRRQRDQLYRKIVGEIESTARDVGKARGLKVVLGGAIAGGTGVDLTSDVEHDLEKSHA